MIRHTYEEPDPEQEAYDKGRRDERERIVSVLREEAQRCLDGPRASIKAFNAIMRAIRRIEEDGAPGRAVGQALGYWVAARRELGPDARFMIVAPRFAVSAIDAIRPLPHQSRPELYRAKLVPADDTTDAIRFYPVSVGGVSL